MQALCFVLCGEFKIEWKTGVVSERKATGMNATPKQKHMTSFQTPFESKTAYFSVLNKLELKNRWSKCDGKSGNKVVIPVKKQSKQLFSTFPFFVFVFCYILYQIGFEEGLLTLHLISNKFDCDYFCGIGLKTKI